MTAENIEGKQKQEADSPASPQSNDVAEFRDLSYELLRYSTQGLLRKDFLPKVTEKIMDHSGSDAVEIWVKEDTDKHFRCLVSRSKKMSVGFILVPSALGTGTELPPEDRIDPAMEKICCSVIRGSVDAAHPSVTGRGSILIEERGEMKRKGDRHSSRFGLPGTHRSIVIIPIRLDEECVGLLQMKSRKRTFFSPQDLSFYEDISNVLGVALSHQYAQIELRERIKEITCLYGIVRLTTKQGCSFPEVIQGITNLLPPAWLYPEITCARIVLNGASYETENYRKSPYLQTSDIVVNDEKAGFVEVAYLEQRLTFDEGPFLAEERNLIDSVAREVAIYYERSRAAEEKAALQEQLRHTDRLATIGQLAAGVAHELNEPLGNILGFAQLARKTPDLPGQVTKDLKYIETASLNAREIIKKLLTFARQLPPKKVLVDLNSIVNEGLAFFEARSRKTGIQVVHHPAPDLPKITLDPGQINQVIVNLVVNAIQAMPEGGTLTVGTRLTKEGLCLSVEDSGIGMTEETIKQIFLPFFTTKDIDEGTGLGLAVVHGIVTAHGGRIHVESEPGRGSRFLVFLPLKGRNT